MKAMTTMFCGMTKLFILTVLAITFIASSVAAFADPPILKEKEVVALMQCPITKTNKMEKGGVWHYCLVYKMPKDNGKTWFAVYKGEEIAWVFEGDDKTAKLKQVWHHRQHKI